MKAESENSQLIAKLFLRLLPIQILLAVSTAVDEIISGFFASNFIGTEAMSAIGLYAPINLFIIAISLMFIGGSLLLCGKVLYQRKVHAEGFCGQFYREGCAGDHLSRISRSAQRWLRDGPGNHREHADHPLRRKPWTVCFCGRRFHHAGLLGNPVRDSGRIAYADQYQRGRGGQEVFG